jgi:hypothetical protein
MTFKLKLIDRSALKRLAILAVIISSILGFAWSMMIWMPGISYSQALPTLTESDLKVRDNLKRDVEVLSGNIGARNNEHYENLMAAQSFLTKELIQAGYRVNTQDYKIKGKTYSNLEVEIPGTTLADEILVIGAHYDSAYTSPGANDNGTGTAALLALAREFVGTKPLRTLRFVAFTNEEPPFFWTEDMGSSVYAKAAKARGDKIIGMFSLETIGYFSNQPNSQNYPYPLNLLYPDTGNFIGFVGNIGSRELLRNTVRSFRAQSQFPSEGAALPNALPGVGWSDQWSFWQQDYQALMITDTATFRYPFYHTAEDTIDKIDFDKATLVVKGISRVIRDFVGLAA